MNRQVTLYEFYINHFFTAVILWTRNPNEILRHFYNPFFHRFVTLLEALVCIRHGKGLFSNADIFAIASWIVFQVIS